MVAVSFLIFASIIVSLSFVYVGRGVGNVGPACTDKFVKRTQ